jgi:hypothetical protein
MKFALQRVSRDNATCSDVLHCSIQRRSTGIIADNTTAIGAALTALFAFGLTAPGSVELDQYIAFAIDYIVEVVFGQYYNATQCAADQCSQRQQQHLHRLHTVVRSDRRCNKSATQLQSL